MKYSISKIKVKAQLASNILLEDYTYTPGMIEPIPKHCHENYQLCLSLNSSWRYFCRGKTLPISDGVLSLINPEDAHSVEEKLMTQQTSFLAVYLEPEMLQNWLTELREKPAFTPRFETVLESQHTVGAFLKFWQTHVTNSFELERDTAQFDFFSLLFISHSLTQIEFKKIRRTDYTLERVRDYLVDNLTENVTTKTLSCQSGLEPAYLIRAFRQKFGVSPHQFHLQRRIEFAKMLLLKQLPLTYIAHETGFFDQSHFGLHFRRLVGVSPQKYRR